MIHTTFGTTATADRYIEISQKEQLLDLISRGALANTPLLIIGSGSNIIFTRHFNGTVLHLTNKGITLRSNDPETDSLLVEAAAGEEWDPFVQHCINHGWYGTENLAAIPGTVGAAPVQNVGAYGKEAKDIIHSVQAIHIATGQERTLSNLECQFGYRDSIFKNDLKGQYIIWSVTFHLRSTFSPDTQYKALSDALAQQGITTPTARQLADIIASVRWSKLPRPEETGSAGSFFKNPIVSPEQYQQLLNQYPDIVAYPSGDQYKLSAGWLIDRAGWKGRTMGRCGVYPKQALVLTNLGGCTGNEILTLSDAITSDIQNKFNVTLQKEAIII